VKLAAAPGASQLSLFTQPNDQRWRVRVSPRARRMTIRVFAGGRVEIAVPRTARPGAIERFVGQHREWIARKIEELGAHPAPIAPVPERIDLAFSGESWLVEWLEADGPLRLRTEGTTIRLSGSRSRIAEARGLLQEWLIDRARERLEPMLQAVARATGLGYERMQVRRQRTRWGSCSRRGTISLNCCLLFQPPAVVRYLLVHELCHTCQMNHSARFWRLVEQHEPDHRRLDRELVRGWRHVPAWVFGLS
jgi:predicted metal-dependent hydrolase